MTKNWKQVPFHTLFRRIPKRTRHGDKELLSVYRDYGVIIKSDREDNSNRPGESLDDYQLVNPGDLVLNKMKTWQGSLGVSAYKGIVSPAYFVYEPQGDFDNRYMHHLLRSQPSIDYYGAHSKGIRVNQWDLQPEYLDKMKVWFPPLDTQQRIADYLDRETAEIDAAMADLDRYVELLRKRRAVTITETVSNNSYPVKPLWGRVKVQNGYAFDAKSFTNEGDIPLARIRDILAEEYETFIQRDSIPSNRYIIRNGDLVIGMDGDFNSTVWKRGEAALNQRVCIVHTNDHTSTRFIAYAIQKPLQVVNDLRYSTTVKHLSQDDIYSMRIPLPDLETQREIADYLDEETTRIDALITESTQLRDLLLKRRSVLITDVVTGRKKV